MLTNKDVTKGHHGAYQVHYHMVFPVKYRKSLLSREVCQVIEETSVGIQDRYAIEFEALGMDGNHIHVLCGSHPNSGQNQPPRRKRTGYEYIGVCFP